MNTLVSAVAFIALGLFTILIVDMYGIYKKEQDREDQAYKYCMSNPEGNPTVCYAVVYKERP